MHSQSLASAAFSQPSSAVNNTPPHNPRIKSFLGAQDNDQLDHIINLLRRLQRRVGMRTRFHLFVAVEVESPPEALQSSFSSIPEVYSANLNTQVLQSPTISFKKNGNQDRKLLHDLVKVINELSFQAMNPTVQRVGSVAITPTPQRRRTIPRLFPSDDEDSLDEDLHSIEPFAVPDWFPFILTEYLSGPPASSSDPLRITEDVAGKFDSLPNDDISNLYRTFFELLHSCAKKKKRSYKQGKLKYSVFTPPWIRTKLIVAGNVCTMPKLAIQDQREQRNKQGYRRMAWLMAAFHENESSFGRYVLDYLLKKLPQLKEEWGERNENRKQLTTPIQRVLRLSKKKARRRSSPQDRRQVRRRLDVSEDPRQNNAAQKTIPEANNRTSHDQTGNNFHVESDAEVQSPIQRAKQSPAIQRESLESMNQDKPEPARTDHVERVVSEAGNGIPPNAKSRKSVFEGLSPPIKRSTVNETGRNERLRNDNQHEINGHGTASQLEHGGPPVIAISSTSGGSKPPTGKTRQNRTLKDIPITIEAPDNDPLISNARQQRKRSTVLQRKKSEKRATNEQNSNPNQLFMSLHGGVRFNLELDKEGTSGSQQLPAVHQSSCSEKIAGSGDSIHAITCAACTKCILRNSVEAQDPDSITGRCRGCAKHLHDLCGGGEDGNMLCPSCLHKHLS